MVFGGVDGRSRDRRSIQRIGGTRTPAAVQSRAAGDYDRTVLPIAEPTPPTYKGVNQGTRVHATIPVNGRVKTSVDAVGDGQVA